MAGGGVADDTSLAYVASAGFELGFDQDYGLASPFLLGGAEGFEDGGQDEGGGDEGDVHCEEGWGGGVGCEEFGLGEEAGVGALAKGDAGIVAEFLGYLAVASVHCEDGFCAALEHAVGEASGGGSYVDAGEIGQVDAPVGEGVLEFEAAAADVFEIGAEESDGGGGRDGGAGLVDALLVYEDAACEDEGLGSFAGGGVAPIYEEFVEADFLRGGGRHGILL